MTHLHFIVSVEQSSFQLNEWQWKLFFPIFFEKGGSTQVKAVYSQINTAEGKSLQTNLAMEEPLMNEG